MNSKRAAIEMSTTTIVVIVLSVSLLIFGMIFIKNIMCSGINLTNKITEGVENEIKNLYSVNDYGVKCMGEGGEDVKLGDGGTRQIGCVIKVNEQTEFDLVVKSIESLSGTPTDIVQNWIIDQDWTGKIAPGFKTVVVAVLKIPQKVSETHLKIIIEGTNKNTGSTETYIARVNIVHVGGLTSAIC